jgi:hypothetical protein
MVNIEKAVFACPQKIAAGKFFFKLVKPEGTFIHIRISIKESPLIGTLNVYNICGVNDILSFVFVDSQLHIQHFDCGKYFFNIITQPVAIDYNFGLSILIISVDGYFHIFDYAVYLEFLQAMPSCPAKNYAQNAILGCQAALAGINNVPTI